MCLHAPSITKMDKQEFIDLYVDKITFIDDRTKRIKYLSSKYDECVSLLNPARYKEATESDVVESVVTEPEQPEVKPKRNSAAKKHTEKRE